MDYTEIALFFLLLLNLVLVLVGGLLRILFIKKGEQVPKHGFHRNNGKALISIHLAICNEPLPLLKRTIKAAMNQSYPNYELIVVSNNYKDKELVESIEGFLKNRGPKIKFVHKDYIEGYKAGALNLSLSLADPYTDYIFTLDSDYILSPDALNIAVNAVRVRDLDVIQFPQNYRNTCAGTRGLQEDFKHYFNIYSMPGNSEGATLPTGTLTLIKRSVLMEIGGWPTNSITEDAELGTRLISKGFRTGYDPRSIGKGLMPSNLPSFYAQRSRWIFGNMQTLLNSFERLQPPFRIRLTIWLQLTAWINFLALPMLAIISAGALIGLGIYRMPSDIVALALLNLIVHFAAQHYLLAKTSFARSTSAAMAIHLATLDWGAFIWLQNFSGWDKPFKRTSKNHIAFSCSYRYVLMPTIFVLSGLVLALTSSLVLGYTVMCIGGLILWGKYKLVTELRNIPNSV